MRLALRKVTTEKLDLDNHGVTVVDQLLSEKSFGAVKEVVDRYRPHSGNWDQPFQRTSAHNLDPLVHVHHQLQDYASQLFKEPLKASYVFLSKYHRGGTCPLHIDRPTCYRTIDLCINDTNAEPWTIKIAEPWTDAKISKYEGSKFMPIDTDLSQLSDRWHEVSLRPNQAVCYSGTHSWHLRPTVTDSPVDLVFFHFVPKDYAGDLR
jgi:hypothetical protein